MKSELLMAVDLGTSFIKVGVYDTQSRCIVAASEPVNAECPAPGVYIQYGEEIFSSVINCIKKATEEIGFNVKDIAAIAFTGQMAGFMGVDKDWNDVTTYSCSLDTRFMPYVNKSINEYADLILDISGTNCPVMGPKIDWFRNEYPAESKKIVKYIMIGGYILGRMGDACVEQATINRSYMQWTGLADIRNDTWSDEICGNMHIDIDMLPRVVDANVICAKLAPDVADLCGLKSGTPLVAGAGDKPAGCLGAAIVEPGDAVLEASSYAGLSFCVKDYRPDFKKQRLDVIPSAIPGEFYMHYYIAGSGITLDWFIYNFNSGMSVAETFEYMDDKVQKITPGSDGILAIGMLGGSALPVDGNLRGLWMNFNWSHKKEHFYRALLESFSYEFKTTFDRIGGLYPEYDVRSVGIIGGGAKSKTWTQINADICQKNYYTLNRKDLALWGAAIIAGSAVGLFDDMKKTAKEHVRIQETYQPDIMQYKKYEPYMNLYNKYIHTFHNYFEEIQTIV